MTEEKIQTLLNILIEAHDPLNFIEDTSDSMHVSRADLHDALDLCLDYLDVTLDRKCIKEFIV